MAVFQVRVLMFDKYRILSVVIPVEHMSAQSSEWLDRGFTAY